MVAVRDRGRPRIADQSRIATLRETLERPRVVAACLLGLFALSTILRIALVVRVHAPTVFSDELGYNKLAQSIGQNGKLALFNKDGLSYSPLYSVVLSPIYALGASAPHAYDWIKISNAFLISLSIFPIYKIARFALSRRSSLLVAVLSTFAPVLSYASFTMSENLAYPVCLGAVWMMLRAIREPRVSNDALLLCAIVVATATRVQLIVLVPAALTAVLLAGLFERQTDDSVFRAAVQGVVKHRLLFGGVGFVLGVAGVGALIGVGIFSAFGRYANVGSAGLPNLWHFLNLAVRHVAGIDLAVGVVPFAAALVAAFAFVRAGLRGKAAAFAAVAVSVTGWLLVEVAWDAALFDSPSRDIPRIHERFLIYVVPFFLVALVATGRVVATVSKRVYLGAAVAAALLPLVIPFDTVINSTVSFESFGLEPFARVVGGQTIPAQHATLTVIWIAFTFGLLFVVVRERTRSVVTLVLIAFLLINGLTWTRIESAGMFARAFLPAHSDWVDRATGGEGAVLVTSDAYPASALETAYSNMSVKQLYYICNATYGPEFGERRVVVDRAERLRDSAGIVKSLYAVMPAGLVARGRIVASNATGAEVLVAPQGGVLSLPPGTPPVRC